MSTTANHKQNGHSEPTPTTQHNPDWHPDLAVRTERQIEKADGPFEFSPMKPWQMEFTCDTGCDVFEDVAIVVTGSGYNREEAAEKAQLFVEAIRRKGAMVYDGDDGEPDKEAVAAVKAMLKSAIAQFPVSQHDSLCAQLVDAWGESEADRGVVDVETACRCHVTDAEPATVPTAPPKSEPQPATRDSKTYAVVMVDVPNDWQPTSDRALPPGATNSIPFDLAEKLALEWNRQRLATDARIDHWSVVASYKGKHRVMNVAVTPGWQPQEPHELPPSTIHTSYTSSNGLAATAAVTACNRIIRDTGESINRWAVRIVKLNGVVGDRVSLWYVDDMPFVDYYQAVKHARILNETCQTNHQPVFREAVVKR